MTWPLIILAFCCIFSGWTFQLGVPVGPPPVLERMLEYGEPYRSIDVRPDLLRAGRLNSGCLWVNALA